MSEWYYQLDRCLGGPISFKNLARLVVDEELTDVDVVCRAGNADWVPISSLVGLRRACEVLSGQRHYVPPTAAEIAESGVYPITREELQQRTLIELRSQSRPRRKCQPAPMPATRLRGFFVWAVLAMGAVGVCVLLYDQLIIGARNQPTYERYE